MVSALVQSLSLFFQGKELQNGNNKKKYYYYIQFKYI